METGAIVNGTIVGLVALLRKKSKINLNRGGYANVLGFGDWSFQIPEKPGQTLCMFNQRLFG
jgi:hypothetical protein